jgi:hypothetical protein
VYKTLPGLTATPDYDGKDVTIVGYALIPFVDFKNLQDFRKVPPHSELLWPPPTLSVRDRGWARGSVCCAVRQRLFSACSVTTLMASTLHRR